MSHAAVASVPVIFVACGRFETLQSLTEQRAVAPALLFLHGAARNTCVLNKLTTFKLTLGF